MLAQQTKFLISSWWGLEIFGIWSIHRLFGCKQNGIKRSN